MTTTTTTTAATMRYLFALGFKIEKSRSDKNLANPVTAASKWSQFNNIMAGMAHQ